MEVTIYKMIFKKPNKDDYNEEEEENYEENDTEKNNEEENNEKDSLEEEENNEEGSLEEKKEENKEVKLKIIGKEFLKNNKNKAKLIINNKKHNLNQFLKIKDFNDENIKVKMILSRDICNLSCIFKNCDLLLNLTTCNYNDNCNDESNEFIGFKKKWKIS